MPKGWKLTLDSDLETLICTWKKDALSCKSKVDIEDKGEFADEKPNLDVPFGGSYTITETSTSDFEQEGTGKFGPLDPPKGLDAYFEGDDSFVAVVTNHFVGEAAPSTTEETTTTTEAPPTTLAADDGSTTTVVEDGSTTTVADEPTTTVADEPSTTLAEETTTSLVEDTSTTEAPATTLFVAAKSTTRQPPSGRRRRWRRRTPQMTRRRRLLRRLRRPRRPATSTTASVGAGDPSPMDDLAVRDTDLGSGVEPASDTLPVTGGATISVAATGFVLLAAGLVILALSRRRSVS